MSSKDFHTKVTLATLEHIQKSYPQCRLFRSEAILLRQYHSGSIMKMGTPGHPDLYGILPLCGIGVFIGIEIKTGKAKLSPEQLGFQMLIKNTGGLFVVGRENIQQTANELDKHIDKLIKKMTQQPVVYTN